MLSEPVLGTGGLRLDEVLLVAVDGETGDPERLVLAVAVPQVGKESAGVAPGDAGIVGDAGREGGIS